MFDVSTGFTMECVYFYQVGISPLFQVGMCPLLIRMNLSTVINLECVHYYQVEMFLIIAVVGMCTLLSWWNVFPVIFFNKCSVHRAESQTS